MIVCAPSYFLLPTWVVTAESTGRARLGLVPPSGCVLSTRNSVWGMRGLINIWWVNKQMKECMKPLRTNAIGQILEVEKVSRRPPYKVGARMEQTGKEAGTQRGMERGNRSRMTAGLPGKAVWEDQEVKQTWNWIHWAGGAHIGSWARCGQEV